MELAASRVAELLCDIGQFKAPLTTFTRFPSLPVELRLRIWRMAMGPRTVLYGKIIHVQTPVPAVLHICKESRTEALRHYRVIKCIPPDKRRKIRPLYFNIVDDTLFIASQSADDRMKNWPTEAWKGNPVIELAHHIAISALYWGELYPRIRKSTNLKSLVVVWDRANITPAHELRLVEEKKDKTTAMAWRKQWENHVHDAKAKEPEWEAPKFSFASVEIC